MMWVIFKCPSNSQTNTVNVLLDNENGRGIAEVGKGFIVIGPVEGNVSHDHVAI